jgi:hypothetical protein
MRKVRSALLVALLVATFAPFSWSYTFSFTWVYPPAPEDLSTKSESEQAAWYESNRQKASPWVHFTQALKFPVNHPSSAALIAGFAFVPTFLIGLFAFRQNSE